MAAIDCVVAFPDGPRPPVGAVVRFRIEDATLLDTPAIVIATASLPVERDDLDELPFTVHVEAAPDPELHSVRVHVDRNGSGRIEEGDWVSVQRHHVGYGPLRIPVQLVE